MGLYFNIDLHRLPPSGMDVGRFIMELAMTLSSPREERFDAFYRGASLQLGNSSGGLGVVKDPSPVARGLAESKNDEG